MGLSAEPVRVHHGQHDEAEKPNTVSVYEATMKVAEAALESG